ncbi:unnamed protein product [Caenorhabditis sp. 36 PRJEB53466]|nr:unnamed protein product [Caenorhabditis sp. 36 PRJEB53466]
MSSDPLNPSRFAHHPALARIIESYAQNAAAMIRDNRDREKREIADLNDRLARYVEKVRFLEAQNRVLENDIGLFRQAAHLHSQKIAVYYEAEKTSLFTLIRENEAKVSSAEQNIRKLEPEVKTARASLESSIEQRKRARADKKVQLKKLSEIEAENAYIKRLINDSEEEKSHINAEISRLRSEIKRNLALRDKERGNYSRAQATAQELLKRLNGNITQHEIAIRDEISKARRDTTDKNRDYFHKELQSAMKEIRDQFEKESRKARKTWDEWYKSKISEIKKGSERFSLNQNQAREEIHRIRSFLNELRNKISDAETTNQQHIKRMEDMRFREEEDLRTFELALTEKENAVIKMREECTKMSVELDRLCENQVNLHNEITHYRKLLDNAENLRTTFQSNFVIDTPAPTLRTTSYHSYGTAYTLNAKDSNDRTVRFDNIDLSIINHNQFRSSSKGDIKFIDHNDESVTIENSNGYRSHDLSNWKIQHYVNGGLVGLYIFPVATHIQPGQKITIHSSNSQVLVADHIAYQIASFNFSKNTKTILVDEADEEVGWYAHVTYSH